MISSSERVGNDAGWHLRFFTQPAAGAECEKQLVSIGAGDYYANVEAALPSGLEGGAYRFTIEGITNSDYKQLHQVWSRTPHVPLLVDLYLYWRDVSGPLGYLTNVAGLTDIVDSLSSTPDQSARVARLLVTRLSRRVGERRFEAVIEAGERVYDALRKRVRVPPPPAADPVAGAARVADDLLNLAQFTRSVQMHTLEPDGNGSSSPPAVELRSFKTGLRLLAALEEAMVAQSKRAGRGMYLIRDGQLHVGPGRPMPLEGETKLLDDVNGLVHVETASISQNERAADADDDAPPARVQYQLTLKGRPDLRPGDTVSFRDPFTDSAGNAIDSATGVGGPPSGFADALKTLGSTAIGLATAVTRGTDVELYVSGVSHTLSRTEGFVTTLTGVRVTAGEEWDPVGSKDGAPDTDPPATPHAAVANAIQELMQSSESEQLSVGEIRAAHTSGTSEPPAQTVDVWVGLAAADGAPRAARRLAIDRDSKSRLSGVPYLTPFAWGHCGLVLPRYPGTRVVVGHVGGSADDPVDVGAVWESGHGPASLPGDWWLILPAAVEPSHRQSATDNETPQEPSQQATNDLIDAKGARVIEVGRLTVRVRPGSLGEPGARPAAPSDSAEEVTIEHENGSRIVIKDNGDIVIESTNDLTVTAKSTLTLEADDVRVKVKNTMDVVDR